MNIAKQIRMLLQDVRRQNQRAVDLYNEVYTLLIKFTGKRVDTKRTLNFIREKHPSWVVSFNGVVACQLRIWGGDSGYPDANNCGTVFIGYENETGIFKPEKMREHNIDWLNNNLKEIEKIDKLLANDDSIQVVAETIDAFNSSKKSLCELIDTLPANYKIKELADL